MNGEQWRPWREGRKSHNEMGNLPNIYLEKRRGEGLNNGLAPPRPSGKQLGAACCAAPRAGRASGPRRLPPNPHPSSHPNPQPRAAPAAPCGCGRRRGAAPGARLSQPVVAGVPRRPGQPSPPSPPWLGSALCFRTVPSRTLNPGGVRRARAVGSARLAKVKITRKYRYISFGLFSARVPRSSRCIVYVSVRSSLCPS